MHLKNALLNKMPFAYNFLFNVREFLRGRKKVVFSQFDLREIGVCTAKQDPIIIDIGCNDGDEIKEFLRIYPGCMVIAIEADPGPYRRLEDRFKGDARVKCFNIAIADHNGELTFNRSSASKRLQGETGKNHDVSGSILPPKLHTKLIPDVCFDEQIQINCATLDSFISSRRLPQPDFIWMDVQGAEFNVFKGGEVTLQNAKAIYTEYSFLEIYQGQKDLKFLADHLKQYGFMLEKRFPTDALFCKQCINY